MTERRPDHAIDPLFLERWSPRAYDQSDMPEADMWSIFEAARWAPSSYNYQPWRFLYARRGSADWDRFLGLLVPGNQAWAKLASVLIFALSDREMDTGRGAKPAHSHSFDCGSAWMAMALQATRLGYQAHGMVGVDFEGVARELGVPATFRVEAGIAIGRQAPPDVLPENLRAREEKSGRRPASESFFAGRFPSG